MRPTLPLTSAGGVGRQSCGVRYYRPPRGRDTLNRPMAANRVFFPQEALEVWTADGRASVEAETMLLGGTRFLLTTGLRFTAEVAGGGDPEGLVGKCKSVEQVKRSRMRMVLRGTISDLVHFSRTFVNPIYYNIHNNQTN